MERFDGAFSEEVKKYRFVDRPRGRPQDQADVAVDAVIRLCLGMKDGETITDAEDMGHVENVDSGGLLGAGPQFRELVKKSLQTREERKGVYV